MLTKVDLKGLQKEKANLFLNRGWLIDLQINNIKEAPVSLCSLQFCSSILPELYKCISE